MTIPLVLNVPLHVWLGIILGVLLTFQIIIGVIMVKKGKINTLLPYHRFNAVLIIIVGLVHLYFGIGFWFFNFKIK